METRLLWEQESRFESDIFCHLGTLTAMILFL